MADRGMQNVHYTIYYPYYSPCTADEVVPCNVALPHQYYIESTFICGVQETRQNNCWLAADAKATISAASMEAHRDSGVCPTSSLHVTCPSHITDQDFKQPFLPLGCPNMTDSFSHHVCMWPADAHLLLHHAVKVTLGAATDSSPRQSSNS